MQRVLLTESNKSLLNQGTPYYFVIESDVSLSGINLNISGSSVFDFRGGCFTNNTPANEITLNFHHAAVMAPPYCIFEKGIKVAEIGTNLIHAEWFHAASMKTHEFVNRALEAAARVKASGSTYNGAGGCPVTLEAKEYVLEGTITFPNILDNFSLQQTLIIPGQLRIDDRVVPDTKNDPKEDFVAIEIREHAVNLQINRIFYTGSKKQFFGTAIRFTANSYHSTINVFDLHWLKKGIDISPVIPSRLPYEGDVDKGTDRYSSAVQYLQVNFQQIHAEYCFYIDVYTRNGADVKTAKTDKWFTESLIRGGRLSGKNGIFFVDPESLSDLVTGEKDAINVNGLVFDNIGFEGLGEKNETKGGIPLALRNVDQSVITNIRMAESLPGISKAFWDPEATWIEFKKCRRLNIFSKTFVHPNHIKIEGLSSEIIINGPVVNDPGWYTDHYNMLAILSMSNADRSEITSQMIATSSIQPVNVAKTLELGYRLIPTTKTITYKLKEILPLNEIYGGEGDRIDVSKVNILPRTLNVRINKGYTMVIDVTGLSRFSASAVIDIAAMITSGGTLTLKFSRESENYNIKNDKSIISFTESGATVTGETLSVTTPGLYRLTFNVDWQLVVTKIATY